MERDVAPSNRVVNMLSVGAAQVIEGIRDLLADLAVFRMEASHRYPLS